MSDVVLVPDKPKSAVVSRRRVLMVLASIAVMSIVGFGLYASYLNRLNRLDDSAVRAGTRWSGRFEFEHAPSVIKAALLEIKQRQGSEVSGIYTAENTFAWDVAGQVEDGRIHLQFVRADGDDRMI